MTALLQRSAMATHAVRHILISKEAETHLLPYFYRFVPPWLLHFSLLHHKPSRAEQGRPHRTLSRQADSKQQLAQGQVPTTTSSASQLATLFRSAAAVRELRAELQGFRARRKKKQCALRSHASPLRAGCYQHRACNRFCS